MGNSCRGGRDCEDEENHILNHIDGLNSNALEETNSLGPDQYILVTDLSGFTRSTQQYGPIHFASIILRMEQLFVSYLKKCNPERFLMEADNFIGMFKDPVDAFRAACTYVTLITEFNESLPPEKEHFKIIIGGIGIAQGPYLFFDDNLGGFLGQTYRLGFMFGEDLAAKDFFVTTNFADTLLKVLPETKNFFTFSTDTRKGHEGISFQFDGAIEWCKNFVELYPFELAKTTDETFISEDLIDFTRRYDSLEELGVSSIEEWDQRIIDKHLVKDAVTFLFHFDCKTVELELRLYEELHQILKDFDCTKKDSTFIYFSDSTEAFKLAVLLQNLFHEYKLDSFGFGIGKGNLIDVVGTKTHVGDAINTASKIGQDLAKNGEIFCMKQVKDDLEKNGVLDNYDVIYKTEKMSNCKMEFYGILPAFAE